MRWVVLIGVFLCGLGLLAACSSGSKKGAASAVEAYYQALVEKDASRLSSISCAAWEKNARQDLDAFGSVKTALKGLSCQEKGSEGNFTLVTCQGQIVATYGNENQEFSLADRTYRAALESGEWRMCGYQEVK